MKRQPRILEMATENCEDCPFHERGCEVPGGTCIYRAINGVPGHYVGDILQNVGIIEDGWWEQRPHRE